MRIFYIITLLCFSVFGNQVFANKCYETFANTSKQKSKTRINNLPALAEALTKGLTLQKDQEAIFNLYLSSYFGQFKKLTTLLQRTYGVLRTETKYLKTPFREQIISYQRKVFEHPESLSEFTKSFKNSANRVRNNLFQIDANLGFWMKTFQFPLLNQKDNTKKVANKKEFLEYLDSVVSPELRKSLKTTEEYEEDTLLLYKALEKERIAMVKKSKDIQALSQAMLDLIHTVGFGNKLLTTQLKSEDAKEQLSAIVNIVSEREQFARYLDFTSFKALQTFLGVEHPTGLTKNDDLEQILKNIEKDIEEMNFKVIAEEQVRIRSLSLHESPYRSCLGGDCSSNTYFDTALHPSFIYFTQTDLHHKSSGQMTIVLGEATNTAGQTVKTAFLDKIQYIPNQRIIPMLSAIRNSLKEKGYILGIPKEVGNHTDLSNYEATRNFVKDKILPKLKKLPLKNFTPHPHSDSQFSDRGYSRAYQKLEMLEFTEWELDVDIHPGEIFEPYLSEDVTLGSFVKKVLSLKDTKTEEEQLSFIKSLVVLRHIEESVISTNDVFGYLAKIIKDDSVSFKVRKFTLYELIDFIDEIDLKVFNEFFTTPPLKENNDGIIQPISRWEKFNIFFQLFSKKEKKEIIGELSNWKNSNDSKQNVFLVNLLADAVNLDIKTFNKKSSSNTTPINDFQRESLSNKISFDTFKKHSITVKLLESEFAKIIDINASDKYSIGWTALVLAVKEGDLNLTKYLISQGANLHIKDYSGKNVLMFSAENGHLEVLKYLLSKGADIYALSEYTKQTILMRVAIEGHLDITDYLVSRGADIHAKDNTGKNVLMFSAEHGHLELVKYYVSKGISPHSVTYYKKTALMYAVENRHLDVVKYLVSLGVDIEVKDRYGTTPLMLAASEGDLAMFKYLVSQGANIYAKNNSDNNVLSFATRNGHTHITEYLLSQLENIDITDSYILKAIIHGHLDTVKYLASKGANIHAEDNNHNSALMLAVKYGHLEIMEYLVSQGANVNNPPNSKRYHSPLTYAVKYGHLDAVQYLVSKGADVNFRDPHGQTVLMLAAKQGDLPIVTYLVSQKANVNAKNAFGWTALMLAAKNGYLAIVQYLVSQKANIMEENTMGETALELAKSNNHIQIVEYLSPLVLKYKYRSQESSDLEQELYPFWINTEH